MPDAPTHVQTLMRRTSLIAWVLFACSACSNVLDVQTVAVPDAIIAGRMSFRLLPASGFRGREPLLDYDPMLPNSSTYQPVRDDIRRAFEKRGYRYAEQSADMQVAYYATAAPRLDLLSFDYGYGWGDLPKQYAEASQYDRGTVVIDVIAPATHRLLWRGSFKGGVDPNPPDYVKELRRAVGAIVAQFPAPTR